MARTIATRSVGATLVSAITPGCVALVHHATMAAAAESIASTAVRVPLLPRRGLKTLVYPAIASATSATTPTTERSPRRRTHHALAARSACSAFR